MKKRDLMENYRKASQSLRLYKQEVFPTGSRVMVSAEKYEGMGVVVADSLCPLTQLPVQLPNGNVWYYDLNDCEPTNLAVNMQ